MLPSSGTPAATPSSVPVPTPEVSLKQNNKHPVSDNTGESIVLKQGTQKENPLPISDSPGSAPTSHTAPSLQVRSATGSNTATAINTEPQMIAEGVFIGEGRAKSGEKVFLKMERITETNKPAWEKYCRSTTELTLESRSALTYAMRHTKKIVGTDGEVRFINDNYEELADRLGFSKEEFDAFVNLCGKNRFFWAKENKVKIQSIHATFAGAVHLSLNTQTECYVVYASKTANFQIPCGSELLASSKPLTFKEYIDLYSDLLICVGADRRHDDSMHSKGMFRNPYSTIAKTHTGLSMVVRGFTGAVAQKFFPGVQTLWCKPLSSMQYMISSSLQPEDYQISGYSHEEALSAADESIRDGTVFEMPHNSIKISALDRLYRNHAST